MSYRDLPEQDRARIEFLLTPKQLTVIRLYMGGYGTRKIATITGVSRTTVTEHLSAGYSKLRKEGILDADTPEVPEGDSRAGAEGSSDRDRGRRAEARRRPDAPS